MADHGREYPIENTVESRKEEDNGTLGRYTTQNDCVTSEAIEVTRRAMRKVFSFYIEIVAELEDTNNAQWFLQLQGS
jgi:hypothetical protein